MILKLKRYVKGEVGTLKISCLVSSGASNALMFSLWLLSNLSTILCGVVTLDYKDVKLDKKRMEHFMTICEVLKEYLSEVILPNSAELLGIYGRVSLLCLESSN